MRIAFFSEGYTPYRNGAVTMVREMASVLRQEGHEVTLFVPNHPQAEPEHNVVRLPAFCWNEAAYCVARMPHRRWFEQRSSEYDLVHSHHPLSTGRIARRLARQCGVPHVFTLHTLVPEFAAYAGWARAPFAAAMTQHLRAHVAAADVTTLWTPALESWLVEHRIKGRTLQVRPPAVKMGFDAEARQALRRQLGSRATLLLAVGRLGPEKDFELLLRAVSLTQENVRLAIVGEGPWRGRLRSLARRLQLESRTLFVGEVPRESLPAWYSAADMFVTTSPSETLGLVTLEAMACEKPVIGVARAATADLIEDGCNGLLVPPDASRVAEAIDTLASQPALRSRLGSQGPYRLSRICTDDLAGELLNVYEAAFTSPSTNALTIGLAGRSATAADRVSGTFLGDDRAERSSRHAHARRDRRVV